MRDATKARLAGLTKDGKPLNIPIGAKNQLLSLITEMAEGAGGTIPDEKLNKIFVDSTDRWQTTRNPFTAATQAFEKEYGTHAQTRSGKKGPWPWSANQPDELVSLEEQAQQQEQAPAAGATTPTASAPEQDGGFLDALSSIVSGAVTSAPASNPASRPGTPAASPGAAPLSSAITRQPARAYGGRGVTYVEPPVVSHGRGGVSSLAAPSTPAPTTPASPAAFAPRSPDAEKYLLANPTNELKAAFQSKYGYLPPGL
jgi:hypothetical protein